MRAKQPMPSDTGRPAPASATARPAPASPPAPLARAGTALPVAPHSAEMAALPRTAPAAAPRRPYQAPRILFREPLEAMAAICSPHPPANANKGICPMRPTSSYPPWHDNAADDASLLLRPAGLARPAREPARAAPGLAHRAPMGLALRPPQLHAGVAVPVGVAGDPREAGAAVLRRRCRRQPVVRQPRRLHHW